MKSIVVGSCKSQPNELVYGALQIAGTDASLDIAILQGSEEGPTGLICGGMHGDEINGPRLVELVMKKIDARTLKGRIIFVPILNRSGFNKKVRNVPENNQDLNRSFAASGGDGMSYQIASTITDKILPMCDFVVDCHDSGKDNILLPQPRVHVNKERVCIGGCTVDLGKIFGTKIVLEREGEPGMLAVETNKNFDIPVLTIEIGGGLVLWEKLLGRGVAGIENLLIHYKMLTGDIKTPDVQFLIQDRNRFTYYAKLEGLLHKIVSLESEVHLGEEIALISDPGTGKLEHVKSKHCGVVFSIRAINHVSVNDEVMSILQYETCQLHNTKAESVETI